MIVSLFLGDEIEMWYYKKDGTIEYWYSRNPDKSNQSAFNSLTSVRKFIKSFPYSNETIYDSGDE